MITLTREEAQELLNALTMFCRPNEDQVDELVYEGAIETLRDRLSAPELEPVAYLCENAVGHKYFRWKKPQSIFKPIPLYTAPPQREWQGLTEEDFVAVNQSCSTVLQAALCTESILKEKNR